MKCLFCKEILKFKMIKIGIPGQISHYDVECLNKTCFLDNDTRFWGFADSNGFIDDYYITIKVDDRHYIINSCYIDGDSTSIIDPKGTGKSNDLRIGKFIPYNEEHTEEYYEKILRKVLNLKAFL